MEPSQAEVTKGRRPSAYGERPAWVAKANGWADGWVDGAPVHVRAEVVALDLALYAHAACGACKCKTLTCTAQHKRYSDAYRILATCRACKHEEAF
jgi:hypothetical protein